jgi:ribosomal-protein-alanine N-acetyltransferase
MLQTRLTITPYERQHRNTLLNLTYYSQWTHKHLDWYKTGQWIDREDGFIYLAWDNDKLVGYIGLSAPLNGTSWVRLLGIHDDVAPKPVIQELWHNAEVYGRSIGVQTFAVLMITNWLKSYIRDLDFSYHEDIITLNRVGHKLPARPESPVKIYSANSEDLSVITQIDQQAFSTPWQMNAHDLWQAFRISASATVALFENEIVGYQISTRHRATGHLARLAVAPAYQGKRVGSMILYELLSKFDKRGINSITVNTQESNISSLRLYHQYGFVPNGFDLGVWLKT